MTLGEWCETHGMPLSLFVSTFVEVSNGVVPGSLPHHHNFPIPAGNFALAKSILLPKPSQPDLTLLIWMRMRR